MSYKGYSLFLLSQFAMVAITATAFIFGIKSGYRIKGLKFIPFYAAAALLEDFTGLYCEFIYKGARQGLIISSTAGNIFTLVEFILLLNFLLQSISSRWRRRITRCLGVLFMSHVILSWLPIPGTHSHIYDFQPQVFVWGNIFLIVPCLFYFYELFNGSTYVNLKNVPSFWVATGILFNNSCAIPLFLLMGLIGRTMPTYAALIYSLNFLLYSILFSLLIKATLCKIPASK